MSISVPETTKHDPDRSAVRSDTTPFVISAGNDLSFVCLVCRGTRMPSNILCFRIGKSRSLPEHNTKYVW